MVKRSLLGIMLLQSVLLMQAGCSNYEPMDLPAQEPYPPGPGLLSGDKGYFEIDFSK